MPAPLPVNGVPYVVADREKVVCTVTNLVCRQMILGAR